MAETLFITNFRTLSSAQSTEVHEVQTGEALHDINGRILYQTSHGFQEANPIKLVCVERVILKPHRAGGSLKSSLTLELRISHDASLHEAEWCLAQLGVKSIPNAYIHEICSEISFAMRSKHSLPTFNRRWDHISTIPVETMPMETFAIPAV